MEREILIIRLIPYTERKSTYSNRLQLALQNLL